MRLCSGQQIGAYTVEHLLGSGGMASVWAVWHAYRDERYALKVLAHPTPRLRQRLLKEGRAQEALRHPNLLPVLDIVDPDGVCGLLMPLIRGPSLRQVIQQMRLSEADGLGLLIQIAEGLQAAHRAGFVHRDLKPANVLLDLSGERVCPRIADFGLVKDSDGGELTKTGAVMGTPGYAAPEQLLDASRVDARADLFSFGVLLVELLCGQRPFAGDSIGELLQSHQGEPQLGTLGEPLRSLARSLLARDPDQRAQDIDAVLAILRAAAPTGGLLTTSALGQLVHSAVAEHDSRHNSETIGSVEVAPTPHNLPPRPTCMGREDDTAAVAEALASSWLVTLTGPGGVGKTTLAQEVCWSVLQQQDAVYLCPLVEARSAEDISIAVCEILGVSPGRAPVARAGRTLSGRGRVLLVLDNFEHLRELGAETLGAWHAQAPEVVFCVTSRVPLRLPEEVVLPVGPLSSAAALELLIALIAGVRPGFRASSSNRDALISITEKLDRLPLALQLAAGRCRTLPPDKLNERLSGRLMKLRDRQLPARQQTLRAVLQWSWELLSDVERAVLAQCGVFDGDFSLEAAEAVIQLPEDDDEWLEVLDVLADLSERSLVVAGPDGRYRLLQTVRSFALSQPGDPEVGLRHCRFFAEMEYRGESHEAGIAVLRREQSNLRAAHDRALERADADLAARLALMRGALISAHGPFAAGVAMLEQTLALSLSPQYHAALLLQQGQLQMIMGRAETAAALMADARERFVALGDVRGEGSSHLRLGVLQARQRQYSEARASLEVAREQLASCGESTRLAKAHQQLGSLYTTQGLTALAETTLREGLRHSREAGSARVEGNSLEGLGIVYSYRGQPARAREHYTDALAIYERIGNRSGLITLRFNLANLLVNMGDMAGAEESFLGALRVIREDGRRGEESGLLVALALMYWESWQLDKGVDAASRALSMMSEELTYDKVRCTLVLARLRLRQRRLSEAGELLDRIREYCVGHPGLKPIFLGTDAVQLSMSGEHDQARTTLEAVRALPVFDKWRWQRDVLLSCIATARHLGDPVLQATLTAELDAVLAPLPAVLSDHVRHELAEILRHA